jgi:hypothetical protein
MQSLLIALVAILSAVDGFTVPSFVPPKFPVSTIDNDGVSLARSPEAHDADPDKKTHAGRYDVRKTMVWLDEENPNNLNRYVILAIMHWPSGS